MLPPTCSDVFIGKSPNSLVCISEYHSHWQPSFFHLSLFSLDPGQARARFHEHEEAVLIFLLNSSCESQPRLPSLWIEWPWRHPAAALAGRIASLVWTWAEFQVLKIKGENGNGDRPSFQVRYTFKSL